MAQFVLEILDGDRRGEVVSLADHALRIGRKPGNDLVLADEKASGVHAEVALEGDRFVLRDLGSTNGTFLDGRRITEVVLSAGDTFLVGRVKVRFRPDGEAGGATGDDGASALRLDPSRLAAARSSSSVVWMLVLLVAAGGAGGWLWWRGRQQQAADPGAAAHGPRAPLEVAGNRLLATGQCEGDSGWNLRVAGVGFQPQGRAHTGAMALEAAATDTVAHAVASSTELPVLEGRTLQLSAWCRTAGGARVGIRLAFQHSAAQTGENRPFRFRAGTPLQEHGDWTQVAASVAVPPDVDRCCVELVAALPANGSVLVDDVAVVEGADQTPGASVHSRVDAKVSEAAATVIGTGPSLAIRSKDSDAPATLLAVLPVLPAEAPAGAAQLLQDGQLAMSDLGVTAAVEASARGCTLQLTGCEQMQLVFPADNSSGLMTAGDQGFAAAAASGELQCRQVLLGDRSTRCLLSLPATAAWQGSVASGRFWLTVPANGCSIELAFRKQREDASELLRAARTAGLEGRPGEALDTIRELVRLLPHDAEVLAHAVQLRGELLTVLTDRLAALAGDLDEAAFFDTRGGFDRVVRAIDGISALYGTQNLPDAAAVAAMRQQAAERLQARDAQNAEAVEKRLNDMATAFESAQQLDLAAMVRDYVARHVKGK